MASLPYYIILRICEFFNKCCPIEEPSVISRYRYRSDNRSDNYSYNRLRNQENTNRENNIVNTEPKISSYKDTKKERISFRRTNISPENHFEFEIIDDLPNYTTK